MMCGKFWLQFIKTCFAIYMKILNYETILGLYSPTSGSVKILDYDIRTDLDKIRSLIGYCPQIK